jgi:hypothetical protein
MLMKLPECLLLCKSALVRLFIFSGFLFWIQFVFPQEFQLLERDTRIKNFVGEDALGNRFSIEQGILIKNTSEGRILSYSNRQYGPVTHADISDPLNLLVFFRDFGVISFTDASLSIKNVFSPGIMQSDVPAMACYSSRNGFWVFYTHSWQLVRYNFRFVPQTRSSDLTSYGFNDEVIWMSERDNRLFVSAGDLWVFDHFANLLFKVPLNSTLPPQIIDNNVFYLKADLLHVYDFFLRKEDVILLPLKGIKGFFIKDSQTIYLQSDDSLDIFHYSGNFY